MLPGHIGYFRDRRQSTSISQPCSLSITAGLSKPVPDTAHQASSMRVERSSKPSVQVNALKSRRNPGIIMQSYALSPLGVLINLSRSSAI